MSILLPMVRPLEMFPQQIRPSFTSSASEIYQTTLPKKWTDNAYPETVNYINHLDNHLGKNYSKLGLSVFFGVPKKRLGLSESKSFEKVNLYSKWKPIWEDIIEFMDLYIFFWWNLSFNWSKWKRFTWKSEHIESNLLYIFSNNWRPN